MSSNRVWNDLRCLTSLKAVALIFSSMYQGVVAVREKSVPSDPNIRTIFDTSTYISSCSSLLTAFHKHKIWDEAFKSQREVSYIGIIWRNKYSSLSWGDLTLVFQPIPSWLNRPIAFNGPDLKHHLLTNTIHLTLKMTSAQVVETSAANNSSFQNYTHPDDHTIRTTFSIYHTSE